MIDGMHTMIYSEFYTFLFYMHQIIIYLNINDGYIGVTASRKSNEKEFVKEY